MCTETFLHLPREKRDRFLEAAWEEFTTVSFPEASINQIIRRAGIPRGSFYQYFSGKEELLFYLMGLVGERFSGELRRMVDEAGGDLFRAHLLCYDRFVRQGPGGDVLFDRCLRILRLNPGLFLELTFSTQPDGCFLDDAWSRVDLSSFRSQDPDYARQVFLLSLLALAGAVKDTLTSPEEAARHRRELQRRLEIIQNGCLAQ